MHIESLFIENFGPFKGQHRLEFQPIAYGVMATHEKDKDRSNYLGKTSLLEAVRFCLHGVHREKYEDEWITNGEKHGLVTLSLSNGKVIYRSRKRGSSTKLSCGELEGFDTSPSFTQEAAQREIDSWLGLSKEDFATCHAAQGQVASFVTGDPSARTSMVSAWLRLERLEGCVDRARAMVTEHEGYRCSFQAKIEAERARVDRVIAGKWPSEDALVSRLEELKAQVAQARLEGEKRRKTRELGFQRNALARSKLEHDQILEEGKLLKAQLDGPAPNLEKAEREFTECRVRVNQQDHVVAEKMRLASGGFDGVCPVAGISCPARKEIDAMSEEHSAALKHEKRQYDVLMADLKAADRVLGIAKERKGKEERLERLRERARQLAPDAKEFGRLSEVIGEQPEDSVEGEDLNALLMEEAKVQIALFDLWEASKAISELSEKMKMVDAEIQMAREAVAIFKGAQKRVAVGALSEIEDGANDSLASADVDLELGLEWEREGKGLASECDSCGHAFPSSAKVRECQHCKAPRGPKVIRQLEVVRSKVSGAADSLSGLALNFSAASWLRQERGSQWAVAMLDEVFAHGDKSIRRSMSAYLGSMLRSAGFEQALVISHDEASMSALPGRILITSDGTHSKIEVVT